jgi:hypothetical protein
VVPDEQRLEHDRQGLSAMSQALAQASLPTYRTTAAMLEGKNGSGFRLAGWTLMRTLLIGPPMLLVGVPAKKAFLGALIASGLISGLTVLRIFNAGPMTMELGGARSSRAYRSARHTRRIAKR